MAATEPRNVRRAPFPASAHSTWHRSALCQLIQRFWTGLLERMLSPSDVCQYWKVLHLKLTVLHNDP